MNVVFQYLTESNHTIEQIKTDQRLTGLCLLCAYKDTSIDWNAVVNTFAAENPR